jgi:hypothetical protein
MKNDIIVKKPERKFATNDRFMHANKLETDKFD